MLRKALTGLAAPENMITPRIACSLPRSVNLSANVGEGFGRQADLVSHNSALAALLSEREGRWAQGLAAVELSVGQGLRPTQVTWGSLLGQSRQMPWEAGRLPAGRRSWP